MKPSKNEELSGAEQAAIARWDLPAVEGPLVQRRGAGVNVMHLEAVERDAWEQGLAAGHTEGVRRGEAELAARINDVNVKYAALEAILGTLAKPLDQLDTAMEQELTKLALIIAKHLVRRELRIDPSQIIGIIRHTVGSAAARDARHESSPASGRRGDRARETRDTRRRVRMGSQGRSVAGARRLPHHHRDFQHRRAARIARRRGCEYI